MSHTPYLLRRYIDILNEQLHEDPEAATSAATSEPPDEDEKGRIIALQKELKARGANLGTFGPAKDGIDGIIGKFTRNAAAKFPDIAKKYSDVLAAGVSGMPPTQQAPQAPDAQTAKLISSLGALEAVLAKYKIKAEDIDPEDAEVLENINQFSPQEQMEIWRLLAEEKPLAKYDPATKNWYTVGPTGAKTYLGGMGGTGAPPVDLQQRGKLAKFVGKLGGGKGIAKKVATRVVGSAVGGPVAPILATGAALWTAWDVAKALYDTFASTDLEDLEPQDQEIVKRNMVVVLQYEKNPENMENLDPEVKLRLERVLKGLNKLAVQADSEEQA